MHIDVLASRMTDNFFYLLHAGEEGLLIDPIDAELAVERVRALGLTSVRVLVTHGHGDHVGGNDAVVIALGAKVWAPAVAERFPVRHDVGLREGDTIPLGPHTLTTWAMPGHTDDHLSFWTPGHLFAGDVLFSSGVGNCRYGGNVDALYATIQRLATLPDDTRVYPGHDYAARNLEFTFSILPDDPEAHLLADLVEATEAGQLFVTTLGQERRANLFLRTRETGVQAALRKMPEWDTFACEDASLTAFRVLRHLRNQF
jgi:hydroxyacylglutathione hydrolase